MSDVADQVVDEHPPAQTAAEPVAEQPPADEDAALDQRIEAESIALPEGEKLVPLSALTEVRGKYKATKAQAAKAAELEAEVARMRAELDETKPYVEAFKTLQIAKQAAGQEESARQPATDPVLQAELSALAVDFQLYTPDGQPDIATAKRIHDRQTRLAEQAAQQAVTPIHQQSVRQQAGLMYQKAMATAAPDGARPDPAILRDVFGRLDPALVATEDGAREAWIAALGRSIAAGRVQYDQGKGPAKPTAKATDEPPAPLLTEKSGGRAAPNESPLSDTERRAIRDMGITEKEYLEAAGKRPWRR